MSFQRHREKTKDWREWVRRHGPTLAEHGLPPDAVRTELDWFLFLDHGYVQSTKLPLADWWTINLLSTDHARWLAGFIEEQYSGRYPQLVATLRRGGAMGESPAQLDGADVLCWVASARGGFYQIEGADPPITVVGMAVARYADGGPFYLFKCDARWQVVQDWDCGSVAEARELAAEHSGGEPLVWHHRAEQPVAPDCRGMK